MYYIFHMLFAFSYNLFNLKINIFSILFSIVMPDTQYILIITSSLISWKEPIGIRNLQDVWSEKEEILPWDPGSKNFLTPRCLCPDCLISTVALGSNGENDLFDGLSVSSSEGPVLGWEFVVVNFPDLELLPQHY